MKIRYKSNYLNFLNGTEDYGTARALFAQTLDLFIFWALRDRRLRDTSKAVKYSENQNFILRCHISVQGEISVIALSHLKGKK